MPGVGEPVRQPRPHPIPGTADDAGKEVDHAREFGEKMKTRWGTCNDIDRRLWFNLELAKKSPRASSTSWFTSSSTCSSAITVIGSRK